jgi:hypothetical protein
MRYFRDSTLVAVLPDGTWLRLEHRGDIARVRREHPTWDGSVLCAKTHLRTLRELRELLMDHPANIERWNIDPRVVEGRRPEGVQFPLHRLHWRGIDAVGGAKQLIEDAFPGANKTLRTAASELLGENSERAAFRLSVAAAMRGVVSDDELAVMLRTWSPHESHNWAPVDVERFRTAFLRATEGREQRRGTLLLNLMNGQSLSDAELAAILEHTTRTMDEQTQHLMMKRSNAVIEELGNVQGLTTEIQLKLLFDGRGRVLLKNGNASTEAVLQAVRFPNLREQVLQNVKLDDALFDALMKSVENTTPLGENEAGASREERVTRARRTLLVGLALNWTLTPEMQQRIASEQNLNVSHALSGNPACTKEVQRVLIEHATRSLEEWRVSSDQRDSAETRQKEILDNLCNMQTLDPGVSRDLADVVGSWGRDTLCRRHDLPEDTIWTYLTVFDAEERARLVRGLYNRPEKPSVELEQYAVERTDYETMCHIAQFTTREEIQLEVARSVLNGDRWGNPLEAVEGLMLNRALTSLVAETLTLSPDPAVRRAALSATHGVEGVSLQRRLEMARTDENENVRAIACIVPKPGEAIEQLVFHDDTFRQSLTTSLLHSLEEELLVHSVLSDELQRHIAERGTRTQQANLAQCRGTLAEGVMMTLAQQDDTRVRAMVLERPDLSDTAVQAVSTLYPQDAERAHRHQERLAQFAEEQRQWDERRERFAPEGREERLRTTEQDVLQEGRREYRDEADIHFMTREMHEYEARGYHHPLEAAVCQNGVMREWETERGSEIQVGQVSHVRDLPGFEAVPFPNIKQAQALIDGYEVTTVEPELLEQKTAPSRTAMVATQAVRLRARVLESAQVIEQNAEYMGNCTSGYTSRVARGDTRLVGMYDEDGTCRLNIELSFDPYQGCWEPGEINTRFNGYGYGYDDTPFAMRQVADQIAERMNQGDPRVSPRSAERRTRARSRGRRRIEW